MLVQAPMFAGTNQGNTTYDARRPSQSSRITPGDEGGHASRPCCGPVQASRVAQTGTTVEIMSHATGRQNIAAPPLMPDLTLARMCDAGVS